MGDATPPSKVRSPVPESSTTVPLATEEHPLDPADSFFHIEDSIVVPTSPKNATHTKPSKKGAAGGLEDDWDFVEELEDSELALSGRSSPQINGKHKEKASTKSLKPNVISPAAPTSSRTVVSMPTSTKQSSSSSTTANGTSSNAPTAKKEKAKKLVSSKRPAAEIASNSGFKHRIYCTLYNLYHAQPSESPSLSNSPVFMMGAIVTPLNESSGSGMTYSASTSALNALGKENTSSKLKTRSGEVKRSAKDEFLEMCRTLLFFSYRKDFTRLEGYQATSDVGWGCMLRTGQMLLATALQRLYAPLCSGRTVFGSSGYDRSSSSRVPSGQELITSSNAPMIGRKILDWFRDAPDLDRHPYSIHNLVHTSRLQNASTSDAGVAELETGIAPSWFSPTRLARVLRFLVRMHSPERLTLYVPADGVLYVDEVVALCTEPQTATISPVAATAHSDRTYLWWKRYSESGPSVSRSLQLPDFEDSDDDDLRDSLDSSIDRENMESDALYQRALAESIAQYESEESSFVPSSPHSAPVSTPGSGPLVTQNTTIEAINSKKNARNTRSLSPSHANGSKEFKKSNDTLPRVDELPDPSDLLAWSTREWIESSSAPSTRMTLPLGNTGARNSGISNLPSTSVPTRANTSSRNILESFVEIREDGDESRPFDPNDPEFRFQPSSLSDSGHFISRPSTSAPNNSNNGVDWAPLPIVRSDFGAVHNAAAPQSAEETEDYLASPAAPSTPLNLSSWVETHELLAGNSQKGHLGVPARHTIAHTERNHSPERARSESARSDPSPPKTRSNPSLHQNNPINTKDATTDSMALDMSYAAAPPIVAHASSSSSTHKKASKVASEGVSPYSSTGIEPFVTLGRSLEEKSEIQSEGSRHTILEDSVFIRTPPSGTTPRSAPSSRDGSHGSGSDGRQTQSFSLNAGESTPNPTRNPPVAPTVPADFWRPLLVLIPSRLGVSKVNPVYIEHLKFSLASASSVGIVGGKPNKSLYFFAFQDDHVFYLDPHFVHSAVRPFEPNSNDFHDSYKVRFPQKIKFLELDPSLAIGFFLRTRADFEAFCQANHSFAIQAQQEPSIEPIFTIQTTAPDYLKH